MSQLHFLEKHGPRWSHLHLFQSPTTLQHAPSPPPSVFLHSSLRPSIYPSIHPGHLVNGIRGQPPIRESRTRWMTLDLKLRFSCCPHEGPPSLVLILLLILPFPSPLLSDPVYRLRKPNKLTRSWGNQETKASSATLPGMIFALSL